MSATPEIKAKYNLIDRLQSKPIIRAADKITLYRDEDLGRRLGGSEARTKVIAGVELPAEPRRWGALGRLHELKSTNALGENDEAIAELEAEIRDLQDELASTGVTFHLQALSEEEIEEISNGVRGGLGVQPDAELPDEHKEEYALQFSAELLSRVIVALFDADGNEGERLSAADARELHKHFPRTEFARLNAKIRELQYDTAIALDAVDNADFSLSI